MKNSLSEFKTKFKTNELKIYETEFWEWCLRPEQITLGSSVLFLKRECTELSGLNEEEFKDLSYIVNIIEGTLKSTLGYDKINYLMLMMVDDQVHTHILPRYDSVIKFNGKEWIDSCWPAPSDLKPVKLTTQELHDIKNFLKENIS